MSDVTNAPRPSGFALPAAEPAKASTEVAVYHAHPQEIAAAMRRVDDVMDKTLVPLARTRKDVKVITDNWGMPLWGLPVAAGVAVFFDAGIVPWVIAGASTAISTVGGLLHPILRRRAVAEAPPLLQGEARDEVLKLAEARTAFTTGERGKVEAPELDVFVAAKASKALSDIKSGYHGRTDDTEIIALLEKYAAATATLAPEDQQVFDFISQCLEGQKQTYHAREIPKLFDALPAAKQYELAMFVRDTFFNDDGPTVGRHDNGPAFTALFYKIEAMHPRLTVPYDTKPEHIPAKVAYSGNLIQTLTNLADIQEKIELRSTLYNNESFSPAAVQEAVALAIAPERTGVERALMGKLVQRQLAAMDARGAFAYRVRAAFADLLEVAAAEPLSVREHADKIMAKVDHISRGIPTSHRSRDEVVPALDLRQIISFLEVIELMNLK